MRRRPSERAVTVHVVMYDDARHPGPAGDGTHLMRFRDATRAAAFAADKTCYGRPATVDTDVVPARIADRWSIN